jgi:hypothetical protein
MKTGTQISPSNLIEIKIFVKKVNKFNELSERTLRREVERDKCGTVSDGDVAITLAMFLNVFIIRDTCIVTSH